MRSWIAGSLLIAAAAGCGGSTLSPGDDGGTADAGNADAELVIDAGGADAGTDADDADAGADVADADAGELSDTDAGTTGTWRTSLSECWTDPTCPRVMAVAHGGAWDTLDAPYDSNAALTAAFEGGLDGVKIDVRVTADDVPVIAHSSPLEIYESVNCFNDRIEEMTAAEVVECHRVPSQTESFQRLDDVLTWLRGKMVVQLCVKRAEDYQRTVDEIHALAAEDYAFIEISSEEMISTVPTLVGADDIFFLINAASDLSALDTVLALEDPRAFMIELDPTVALGDLATTRLHPAGVRVFTYDDASLVSTAQLKAYFDQGYDVVSTNAVDKVTAARVQVNEARGVTPP